MLLVFMLFIFANLIHLAISSPSLQQIQDSSPQQYYLRTSIVDATNDAGTPKGNLYLASYHVGAGLSDVTFTPNISHALPGYLNTTIDPNGGETTWITNLTQALDGNNTIYYDLCGGYENEANWSGMQINADDYFENFGCQTFYVDGGLLVYGLGGWLACDWWHGVPQLFWVQVPGAGAPVPFQAPSSCSLVDLQMIEVPEEDSE